MIQLAKSLMYHNLLFSDSPTAIVDDAFKNGVRVVAGIIILDGKLSMSWSWCLYFGTCSLLDYAEARAVFEGINKIVQ